MIGEKKQDKVYDLAKNHFLGDFPSSLPIEKAYLHIGIYMGWIIENELFSDYFEDEASTEIYRFTRREIGCIILAEIWNGALSHELFNEEANLFTYYYYAGGIFKKDYTEVLVKSHKTIYHVEDTWENFDKISKRMTERFNEWKSLTKS
ncbi:MAG: hypothetical protein HC819_00850 [Cyclobacteriaceae bacterium]|nr:hypothetical protein [Cyclobacteriaceae bacterium]